VHVTRRQIVAIGAASAAVGAVAGAAGVASWWLGPPGGGYRVLSTGEGAIVRAVADAAFPPVAAIVVRPGGELGIDHFFDGLLHHLDAATRRDLQLLLHAVDVAPLATHAARFHALDAPLQREALADWIDSDTLEVRAATMALLVLLGNGWVLHPDVAPMFAAWHACGFGP
jgi:hypothetical protein